MVDQSAASTARSPSASGALNHGFLGLERPLGEARLLWEIGLDGCEVAAAVAPGARLGVSEPAAALARGRRAGHAVGSASDQRIRAAGLTAAGRAAFDERADE